MKKFFIAILNIIFTVLITFLICLLGLSFSIKKIVVNTISKEVVSKEISSEIVDNAKKIYDGIDYDTLKNVEINVLNSSSINDITEKYFDKIVDYIINDKEISDVDIKSDVTQIVNLSEVILKRNNIEISDEQKEEMINKISQDDRIKKVYQNVTKDIKNNMPSEGIMALKAYDEITSDKFKAMAISMIILLIILIAILKKSYYRWIFNLAFSFAMSFVFTSLIAPFILDIVFSDVSNGFTLNVNSLINYGYICFGICALLIIIYIILNMISKHNKKKYDY